MRLTKIFKFCAAHQLLWHSGKCKNLHGHEYVLEVTVEGDINKNGIVIDFGDVKKIVEEKVIAKYDHKYLNDFFSNPTAELILFEIWKLLIEDLSLFKLKLWETPTSFVEMDKSDLGFLNEIR